MIDLQQSTMFIGVSNEDIQKVCECLSARKKTVPRNSFVFRAGDSIDKIYLILSGSMHIVDEYFWGNRSIVETMLKGTLFGEAYVVAEMERHLVSVIAAEDSVILEIDPLRLFKTCRLQCSCHTQIMQNIMLILSRKIVRLTEKLGHVVQRTTREKVLSYLSQRMRQAQSNPFTIPYSRQQLADYLCVDRSALSHELSKLRDLNMIKYHKNQFELLLSNTDEFFHM